MFIESVLIGIVIGVVQNGRITNLGIARMRGWYLIIMAFLLGISPMFSINSPFFEDFGIYIYLLSLILIFVVILWNLDKKGFWILALGAGLNLFVVLMNHFKMPIYMEGLRIAGLENLAASIDSGEILNYVAMEDLNSWSRFLGKLIVIPKPYPLAKVISIGDLIMSLGIVLYIRGEMMKKYHFSRSRMVSPGYRKR